MSDMTPTDWLQKNFTESFLLPSDASEWLCQLFDTIQFFDDVADCDPVSRETFDCSLWDSLVGMNLNSFYIKNQHVLIPLVSSMILKWQASDKMERNGNANAKSYMWRAGYYDIVLMVVCLCRGNGVATMLSDKVLDLYGETFEEYMKEFNNA